MLKSQCELRVGAAAGPGAETDTQCPAPSVGTPPLQSWLEIPHPPQAHPTADTCSSLPHSPQGMLVLPGRSIVCGQCPQGPSALLPQPPPKPRRTQPSWEPEGGKALEGPHREAACLSVGSLPAPPPFRGDWKYSVRVSQRPQQDPAQPYVHGCDPLSNSPCVAFLHFSLSLAFPTPLLPCPKCVSCSVMSDSLRPPGL